MRLLVRIKKSAPDYYSFNPGECYLVEDIETENCFILVDHKFNHVLLKGKYSEAEYKKALKEMRLRIMRDDVITTGINFDNLPNAQSATFYLKESIDLINVFEI